jgi:dTDP-4-dehydrorhamnose 3,5-epimerase
MRIETTGLTGVVILTPQRHADARGWFVESWNAAKLKEAGISVDFVQDNHAYSAAKATLRGLHLQRPPKAQDKLVRCVRGAILDVVVDARRGLPSYGLWDSVELSAENGRQIFVPKGFLHGYVTLTEDAEVQYKCSDFYAPDCAATVRWDSLGIDWQLNSDPVLSGNDAAAPAFADWTSPFKGEDRA